MERRYCRRVVSVRSMISLRVRDPRPHQVIHRIGFDPQNAHVHGEVAAMGRASLQIALESPLPPNPRLEYRFVPERSETSQVDWQPFVKHAEAPAGGWYRLEVRAVVDCDVCVSG